MLTYFLKTVFLMLMLLNVSYFFGLIFVKFVDIEVYYLTSSATHETRDAINIFIKTQTL